MDLTLIGARLASSFVAPLVKRLFRAEGPGAGMVDKPVRIGLLISFAGEKRTLTDRDFRAISEQLVERAAYAIGARERLPEYELRAVENALVYSLRSLGELDMDDVQAVSLGHRGFTQMLRTHAKHSTVGLSSDAIEFYDRVLETAALHILNFFTQRSTFVARTLVEQSKQMQELLNRIDAAVARTPSPADSGFERRYASYIAQAHNELTIFGLDLTDAPERWPMDAAYLSLDAAVSDTHVEHLLPADRILDRHARVLLRGVAGSGKTTLAQWLAVTAARPGMDERLLYLHGLVPFVLPLRTLTRRNSSLPSPEQFLTSIGCPVASAQPDGWIDRVLTSGRGLLLIDGIDEVPEVERGSVRQWLRNLLHAFPANHWLITSRPSAVRHDWLSAEDFVEFDLAPMSRNDVTSFVKRWHHAAGVGDSYARSLLKTLWSKQDLGRLAINPLMCGLICALHRDRRGYLPEGRKELYDAALSMMLSRRDRERGVQSSDDFRMSEASQVQIIQKIAYWMIRNGRSEMAKSDAVDLLRRALPAMPKIAEQGSVEKIYPYLIVRSGLLREPSNETIDFVHRTFQDYLGARAAVEALDFDYIVANAHLDQWEDVVRMAVAHARPNERFRLLSALLERGDQSGDERGKLYLLAAACLEHATELDPQVHREVQKRAEQLIPPQSLSEARELSEVGPVVLELLSGPGGMSSEEQLFVVSTATRIATDGAIPLLAQYRDSDDLDIRSLLVNSWNRFDPGRYFEEVLAHVDERGLFFPVSTIGELCVLAEHGGRARVDITGAIPLELFREECNPARLTHLRISIEMSCTWEWLRYFHRLERVIFAAGSTVDVSTFPKMASLREMEVQNNTEILGAEKLVGYVKITRNHG
ncbi:NACHT domain-containing protein [Streptomyces sedi]|uniref:NACHT domain-containing protein n=1 Tax=Streptomyces sedi TaxID=555059 RepID=A0A5C4UQ76_9ACTN|nr:NACHT domain-containing protein [Streptomyces sedi]TNM25784.1 NACHT domain-containing protein [Streptomyces sedi]